MDKKEIINMVASSWRAENPNESVEDIRQIATQFVNRHESVKAVTENRNSVIEEPTKWTVYVRDEQRFDMPFPPFYKTLTRNLSHVELEKVYKSELFNKISKSGSYGAEELAYLREYMENPKNAVYKKPEGMTKENYKYVMDWLTKDTQLIDAITKDPENGDYYNSLYSADWKNTPSEEGLAEYKALESDIEEDIKEFRDKRKDLKMLMAREEKFVAPRLVEYANSLKKAWGIGDAGAAKLATRYANMFYVKTGEIPEEKISKEKAENYLLRTSPEYFNVAGTFEKGIFPEYSLVKNYINVIEREKEILVVDYIEKKREKALEKQGHHVGAGRSQNFRDRIKALESQSNESDARQKLNAELGVEISYLTKAWNAEGWDDIASSDKEKPSSVAAKYVWCVYKEQGIIPEGYVPYGSVLEYLAPYEYLKNRPKEVAIGKKSHVDEILLKRQASIASEYIKATVRTWQEENPNINKMAISAVAAKFVWGVLQNVSKSSQEKYLGNVQLVGENYIKEGGYSYTAAIEAIDGFEEAKKIAREKANDVNRQKRVKEDEEHSVFIRRVGWERGFGDGYIKDVQAECKQKAYLMKTCVERWKKENPTIDSATINAVATKFIDKVMDNMQSNADREGTIKAATFDVAVSTIQKGQENEISK